MGRPTIHPPVAPSTRSGAAEGRLVDWVFFDAGNTLIGLDYARLAASLAGAGLSVPEMTIRRAESAARRGLDRAILEASRGGADWRIAERNDAAWREYWRRTLRLCGADPYREEDLLDAVFEVTRPAASWDRVESSTPAALEELASAGYRLGVISNSSGTLKEHLDRIGLSARFEVIVDSHEVGVEKPHPGIFRHALQRAGGILPDRALHIGDVYAIDVLGAASAGLHALLFDPLGLWDPASLPDGSPGCRTLASLADLPAMLRT